MVEFEAILSVTEWTEIHRDDKMDGRDRKMTSITLEENHTVTVSEEFLQGHVNLEAWVPEISPDVFMEKMYGMMGDCFEGEIEIEVLGVRIYGNKAEWITQIDRWLEERPDMTFSEGIRYFMNAEECDVPMSIYDELVERRS